MGISSLLALLPILAILFLMIRRGWGAAKAGLAGYLTALVIGVLFFGAGMELLAYAHLKALLLAFDVLYIVWAAFLHYQVVAEAGAIAVLGNALQRLTESRGLLALILGFAFAAFLQGVGGFGVPVAIAAPLLVGVGFTPLEAVVIPSVGHAWSVTFGSLGSSFQALMAATHLSGEALAFPAAAVLGLCGLASAFLVVHLADGWAGLARLWPAALFIGLTLTAVQLGLAVSGLWNLAAAGAGLVGLIVCVPMVRWSGSKRKDGPAPDRSRVAAAAAGYLILIALAILIQLLPGIQETLGSVALRVEFPEMRTALGFGTPAGVGRVIPWFTHGGAVLLYATVFTYLFNWKQGYSRLGSLPALFARTVGGVAPATIGILTMVAMAVIMSHAGMTDLLARWLAEAGTVILPVLSPLIGALGAFMTGSNTNSNVVFGALQARAAELLGLSVPWILAAQTAGGALGSVLAPTKLVVAAATANLRGAEGLAMRRILPYVLWLMVVTILGVSLGLALSD